MAAICLRIVGLPISGIRPELRCKAMLLNPPAGVMPSLKELGMVKKVWRKPVVKPLVAGSAELGSSGSKDAATGGGKS